MSLKTKKQKDLSKPKGSARGARKKSRKKLIKMLDDVFSKYIRARDGHCICCGTTENLQCGHLLSRVSYSTRWEEMNAHAQCRGCNLKHEYNPHIMTIAFIKKYGLKEYEKLNSLHLQAVKFKDADIEELIEYFKFKISEELHENL